MGALSAGRLLATCRNPRQTIRSSLTRIAVFLHGPIAYESAPAVTLFGEEMVSVLVHLLRKINSSCVRHIDGSRECIQIARNLADDAFKQEIAISLPSKRCVRFPSSNDVGLGHFPYKRSVDGFRRREPPICTDHVCRIFSS